MKAINKHQTKEEYIDIQENHCKNLHGRYCKKITTGKKGISLLQGPYRREIKTVEKKSIHRNSTF
jgi:hypothetical protein